MLNPKVITFKDGVAQNKQDVVETDDSMKTITWSFGCSADKIVDSQAVAKLQWAITSVADALPKLSETDIRVERPAAGGQLKVTAMRAFAVGELRLPPIVQSMSSLVPKTTHPAAVQTQHDTTKGALLIVPVAKVPKTVTSERQDIFCPPVWAARRELAGDTAINCHFEEHECTSTTNHLLGDFHGAVTKYTQVTVPVLTNIHAIQQGDEIVVEVKRAAASKPGKKKTQTWADTAKK